MSESDNSSETGRLEALWAGQFGDEYVERNRAAYEVRKTFWNSFLAKHAVASALEVGCNVGGNLRYIAESVPPHRVHGIDINESALADLRRNYPLINAMHSPARELPFRDGWFDLTLTVGVLIHQPELTLPLVMSELVRTSRRLILCMEYFSPTTVEVPYRGQDGALFKRDYGRLYAEMFPALRLADTGLLSKSDGFDDVTYWLFEKPR